jgi:hypothetical protein
MRANTYAGILTPPSDDFQSVRDNRRTMPFWMDIDLSISRSDTGTGVNAALLVNASGNSFYIDANPNDGIALIEFQDTGSDQSSVRLYCSPGTIFNLPFTQFKITNAVQVGKKIRIVYGTDVDFQPGSVTQISVAGTFAVRPEAPTSAFANNAGLAANTPVTVFTPASNINGAILLSADITQHGTGLHSETFIAKSSAPASVIDGYVMCWASIWVISTADVYTRGHIEKEQYIPAGFGLYVIGNAATTADQNTMAACRYKLL